MEASFRVTHPTNDLVPELAISDIDDFQNPTTTSPHELVIALKGREGEVLTPDGRLAAQVDLPAGDVSCRIRVDQHVCIVELNGRTIFSGAIGLSQTSARYVAVRILRRGAADAQQMTLRSARVLGVH